MKRKEGTSYRYYPDTLSDHFWTVVTAALVIGVPAFAIWSM